MRKLTIGFISTLLFSGQIMAEGLSDGFRGLRWGSEPLSTMYKSDKKANMQGYMRQQEDLSILGAKASDIYYYYYGGGLCRIEVSWWPQSPETLNTVMVSLEKTWGQPLKKLDGNGLYDREWLSSTGITNGIFIAQEDVRTPKDDWFINIITCLYTILSFT